MTKGKRYLIDVVLAIFFYGILFFLSPAFQRQLILWRWSDVSGLLINIVWWEQKRPYWSINSWSIDINWW